MHLIVPFASAGSEAAGQALHTLVLPHTEALLALCQDSRCDTGSERSLSPPHERALARVLGLAGGDGALPWAAQAARGDGLEPGDQAWGLLTPAHWHVGAEQVVLSDPDALALDEADGRALFDAVLPLFESEGIVLRRGSANRWYAAHDSLQDLPTASLDRVVGRNVDSWLPAAATSRLFRRLQSEVQMLLYTHPVNAQREARGLLPVNTFWLSGCGRHRAARRVDDMQVDARLRGPALAEDWAAWAEGWAALDAGPLAQLHDCARSGTPVTLTLCGERSALELRTGPRSLAQRLRRLLSRPQAAALLEGL